MVPRVHNNDRYRVEVMNFFYRYLAAARPLPGNRLQKSEVRQVLLELLTAFAADYKKPSWFTILSDVRHSVKWSDHTPNVSLEGVTTHHTPRPVREPCKLSMAGSYVAGNLLSPSLSFESSDAFT